MNPIQAPCANRTLKRYRLSWDGVILPSQKKGNSYWDHVDPSDGRRALQGVGCMSTGQMEQSVCRGERGGYPDQSRGYELHNSIQVMEETGACRSHLVWRTGGGKT